MKKEDFYNIDKNRELEVMVKALNNELNSLVERILTSSQKLAEYRNKRDLQSKALPGEEKYTDISDIERMQLEALEIQQESNDIIKDLNTFINKLKDLKLYGIFGQVLDEIFKNFEE